MKKKPLKSLQGTLWLTGKRMALSLMLVFSSLMLSAQTVTIRMTNCTFADVAREIERQTELTFLYNDAKVDAITNLNPDFTNADVKAVLDYCLRGSGLSYSIVDNTVVLVPDRKSALGADNRLWAKGKVMDEAGNPLPGVNVIIKGSTIGTVADIDGRFSIWCSRGDSLHFSMVGYESVVLAVKDTMSMEVVMKEAVEALDEVVVVSTGYMRIPKERATGSFGVVTAKELEKRPSANVLNRLEGTVPGVYVNIRNSDMTFLYGSDRADGYQDEANNVSMNIRGKSSLTGTINSRPLIVVDGFPTDFELKSLNPSDIASITFLKDAAAASIWGARAANGVVVIETKKGSKDGSASVNFSMNVLVSGQPRFNTLPLMNSAEMIDYEREMIEKGYITRPTTTDYSADGPVSQAAYLIMDMRDGAISEEKGEAALAELAGRESYRDVKKYLLQSSFSQTYNLSFSGGSNSSSYFLSASYAKERSNMVGNEGDRFTLTSNMSFKLMDWATLTTGIKAAFMNIDNNGLGLTPIQPGTGTLPLMPYDQLVDDEGNRVDYYRTYNKDFVAQREEMGYKNWKYNYLDELDNMDNTRQEQSLGLNVALNLPIPGVKGLSLDGSFMLEMLNTKTRDYANEDTFEARDAYNYATYYNPTTGELTHGLPEGGILTISNGRNRNYSIRGQVNYDNTLADIHQIAALAGIELRETRQWNNGSIYYGYNDETLVGGSQISNPYTCIWGYDAWMQDDNEETDYQRRYLSYYGNVSYSLMSKYVLTGSVRYDDYNNFGLDRKYRATPMWSVGASWHLGYEDFISGIDWINRLTFRVTYGYNGNINQEEVPFTNLSLSTSNDGYTQQPSSSITNAANPSVRWEKVGVLNFGLDFALLNSRLSGSIEWYNKYSRDLFADYVINPIFGANASQQYTLSRNAAKVNGKGLDLALNGVPVRTNDFTWDARLTFSYNNNEVISSPYEMSTTFYAYGAGSGRMIEGYNMDNYWAYRWAGLDENGDSQIYNADGEIVPSTESITNDDLVYVGTTTPRYYGGFMNTFTYKKLSLYVGISYKMGYIFRKPSLTNGAGLTRYGVNYEINEDMADRWRESGDEATTNVPRLGTNSNSFYRYMGADIHILKGDHIRLREVSLSYELPTKWLNKVRIKSGTFGFTVTNLGLIWRSNDADIDPDFIPNSSSLEMAPTPSYNFSLNLNF